MEIRAYKNNEEIYILEIHGDLDLCNSNQIKDMVMKLAEKKLTGLILDLKAVDSIKSEGIGALINISSTLHRMNYALAITNMSSPVERIITATKLKNYLPITPTLTEAIELINKTN